MILELNDQIYYRNMLINNDYSTQIFYDTNRCYFSIYTEYKPHIRKSKLINLIKKIKMKNDI